jgi:glycine/D-amino acid oxidase-like deaminating enzyme
MAASCDVLIVGGGVMGLWAAKFAVDLGLKVMLIDKGSIGGGGSNGLLGALSPHLPNALNEKKRFQLLALDVLPELACGLEQATGLSTGYGRNGRLMPIRLEGFLKRARRCQQEAPKNWELGEGRYTFEIVDAAPYGGWIAPDKAPLGLAYDTLSARAQPSLVTKVLAAYLKSRANLQEGVAFGAFEEASGQVLDAKGDMIAVTNKLVLAAGYETYDLLTPLVGGSFGHGVKGHSALFKLDGVADKPLLYDDGVYVVPHSNGLVAVGSTSEEEWQGAGAIDEAQCTPFIEKAAALCPPLKGAELVGLWAGVRPRSYAKEPIVGRLFAEREIYVLTGGFKISFGIAHRLAEALVGRLTGADDMVELPESYQPGYHFAAAQNDGRL